MSELAQSAAWNAELRAKNHVEANELAQAIMTNTGDPRLLGERVSSDPATRQLAHQVHADGLVRGLRHQGAGNWNVWLATHRHEGSYNDPYVPDVVHSLVDEATSCHLATGWDSPGSGPINRLRTWGN